MKKLMVVVGCAIALGVSAFAAATPWFDGGIADGWPESESMFGGQWSNTDDSTFAEGKVLVAATAEKPLTFTADAAKTIGETNAEFSVTLTFTAFAPEELPAVPAGAKAGVNVVEVDETLTYYVIAKDGETNNWTSTGIEAKANVETTVRIRLADGKAIYTFDDVACTNDVVISAPISAVKCVGEGTLTSLGATYDVNSVRFAIPDAKGATKVVTVDGQVISEPYEGRPGAALKVVYTADEGKLFKDGSNTYTYNGKVAAGAIATAVEEQGLTDAAAKIGTAFYLTLQEALDDGGDVMMLKDATSEVTIPEDTTVNLDFNGFAITTTSRQAINNYGTLTITNGNVTAQEAAVVLWGNSTTTISGGTFAAKDNAVIMGSGNDGEGNVTLTISGGTFNGGILSAGYIACGIYVPNSGTYTISGGTFNITGGCGICARAGTTKIAGDVVINLFGDTTAKGWVGDKKSQVPCVAAYFDWTIPPYPGYADGDTIKAQDNTLTTAVEQCWFSPDADGYYTLAKLPTATIAELAESIPGLDVAYNCMMTSAQVEGFNAWKANFVVTFNKEVKAGSLSFAGQYNVFPWTPIVPQENIPADTAWMLLPEDQVTYADLYKMLGGFNCGVKNLSEDNVGTEMTVKLVLNDGAKTYTIAAQPYKLIYVALGPQTPPTGGGTVTEDPATPGTYVAEGDPSSGEVTIVSGLKDTDTILVTNAAVTAVNGVPPAQITVRLNGHEIDNTVFVGGTAESYSLALNEEGAAADGTPVKPTLVEEEPFVVGDETAVTVKAIPGLRYALLRGDEPGAIKATVVEATVAEETTIELTDETPKGAKAFYRVQVSK